jgi:large subunit ribosomal protein L1
MADANILEAVKKAREGTKKRNFKQAFDLAMNLKSIDIKKPENKIKLEVILPKGVSKARKVGIFADTLIPQVQKLEQENVVLVRKDELEGYSRNKKAAKALANSCAAFVAEAPLMPMIGKFLGPVFAVRNKMPKPIPPTLPNIKHVLDRECSTVKVNVKDSFALHCLIGNEEMNDEDVAANAEAVVKGVIARLPKGKEQFKNGYIKLTMGPSVKFVVE